MMLYQQLKRLLIRKKYLNKSHVSYLELLELLNGRNRIQDLLDSKFISNDIILDALSDILCIKILDNLTTKIKIKNFCKLQEYYKYGYFICKDTKYIQSKPYYVISDPSMFDRIDIAMLSQKYELVMMYKQQFYNVMETTFSKFSLQKSILTLDLINPNASAKNINYPFTLLKWISSMIGLIYISQSLFIGLHYIIYLVQTLFKTWLFLGTYLAYGVRNLEHGCIDMEYKDYPIYTILVPMYKENYGVKSILHYLKQLHYPKNKLDIKFIVEDDDEMSLAILNTIELPDYIDVIKVPYAEPRTKPKALNYAMQYVKGEYVTVYDVEDRPDRDQLLKALHVFNTLPKKIACVQAKLNFYNRHESLLARLFSIEYSVWFNFLLPALDKSSMPVPLGGNSNHFRTDALMHVGLWDAYNVTEDADLGIRLFMNGYRTKVIDSYTLEEAPVDIRNWINQRSRWIKGFIQTFLVYWKQRNDKRYHLKLPARWSIYLFVGLATYTFFLLPLHGFFASSGMIFENQFLSIFSAYVTFLYLYSTASIVIVQDTDRFKNAKILDWVAFFLWPLYFILHVVASYKALWSLMTTPYLWTKTTHKVSEEDDVYKDNN